MRLYDAVQKAEKVGQDSPAPKKSDGSPEPVVRVEGAEASAVKREADRGVPAGVAAAVREIEDEVTFTQTIPRETALGLERKRKERGFRSRSETIRTLLKEALEK